MTRQQCRPLDESFVMDAGQVGDALGYTPEVVRRLAREHRIPAPLDADLGSRLWRWSRREIEQYAAGRAVAS